MALSDVAPEAAPRHRKFKDRPSQVFINCVKAHITQTGQPETFDGLFHGVLAKEEPFVILAEIEVNTAVRPYGDLAPCPMCHASNKFKEGRLVYLHQLGVAAVIGHECAAVEANKEANREWRLREQRRNEEDYLLHAIPLLPRRFTEVGKANPIFQEAESFLRAFRSNGKPFFEALRKVRTAGGQLIVTEEIRSSGVGPSGIRTSGSSIETRDHMIGVLRGQIAVSPTFNPNASSEVILRAINRHRCSSEEEALNYISGLSDLDRAAAVKDLQKAENDFLGLLEKLRDFVLFFGERNFSTVNEWAGHPFSSFRFEVTLGREQSDGCRRFEARGEGSYFQHLIGPALWLDLSSLNIDASVHS